MSHTYTVHTTILAASDEDALHKAAAINKLLGGGRTMYLTDGTSLTVTAMHATDADDYAEQVEPDRLCGLCGAPAVNRLRVGNGARVCRACADAYRHGDYPILDV